MLLYSILETIIIVFCAGFVIISTQGDEAPSGYFRKALFFAIFIGGINCFASIMSPIIATIALLATLASMVLVAWLTYHEAWTFYQLLASAVVQFCLFCTAKRCAGSATINIARPSFWASLVNLLPSLLFIGFVIYYIADYFKYRYDYLDLPDEQDSPREVERKEEDATIHLWAYRLLIAIMIIALILTAYHGLEWRSLGTALNFRTTNFVSKNGTATDRLSDSERKSLSESAQNLEKVFTLSDAELQTMLRDYGLNDLELCRNSLPSMAQHRVFVDAISIPFSKLTTVDCLTSLSLEVGNPIWLAARFGDLCNLTFADGSRLTNYYPSIKTYFDLFNQYGIGYFIEPDGNNGFRLNQLYKHYALYAVLLFRHATECAIVDNVTTAKVWRLSEIGVYQPDGSLDVNKIRVVERDYVEDTAYNTFFVVHHIIKSTGRILFSEYFNVYDRAPATPYFAPPQVAQPTSSKPVVTKPVPTTPVPTPAPTPAPTTRPTNPPPTYPTIPPTTRPTNPPTTQPTPEPTEHKDPKDGLTSNTGVNPNNTELGTSILTTTAGPTEPDPSPAPGEWEGPND